MYYTRHKGIESWEIRMVRKWTLRGSITPRIESIVARYGTMIDNSRTLKEKKEIEHEFVYTMLSHGIMMRAMFLEIDKETEKSPWDV